MTRLIAVPSERVQFESSENIGICIPDSLNILWLPATAEVMHCPDRGRIFRLPKVSQIKIATYKPTSTVVGKGRYQRRRTKLVHSGAVYLPAQALLDMFPYSEASTELTT